MNNGRDEKQEGTMKHRRWEKAYKGKVTSAKERWGKKRDDSTRVEILCIEVENERRKVWSKDLECMPYSVPSLLSILLILSLFCISFLLDLSLCSTLFFLSLSLSGMSPTQSVPFCHLFPLSYLFVSCLFSNLSFFLSDPPSHVRNANHSTV